MPAARVNLLTVIGTAATWVCLFWFNPLIYWALGRLHFDQELACDALVVSGSLVGRGRYARALAGKPALRKKLTLNFQDLRVSAFLELISEVTGLQCKHAGNEITVDVAH